jgi:hypothetical protein
MSDPMTHREIEDVLSSIRRLVSQDSAREPGSNAPGSVDASGKRAGAAAGRLVLTEAQRIATPDAAGVAQEARAALEATIAELEAAVSATPGDWETETETGDAAPARVPVTMRPANVTPMTPRVSLAPRDRAVTPESIAPAPQPAESGPDRAMTGDGFVAAGASDAVGAFVPDVARESFHNDATDPGDDMAHDTLSDDGAMIEDTEIIDEATLRAMVAQIVREELHGQLGERITRSVRKLVRAEIARALDANRYL